MKFAQNWPSGIGGNVISSKLFNEDAQQHNLTDPNSSLSALFAHVS